MESDVERALLAAGVERHYRFPRHLHGINPCGPGLYVQDMAVVTCPTCLKWLDEWPR